MCQSTATTSSHFNPRPRKEGYRIRYRLHCFSYYFNPRPRKEGEFGISCGLSSGLNLNPRRRKEGDHLLQCLRQPLQYFNPRPREEGDYQKRKCFQAFVFQSTPS